MGLPRKTMFDPESGQNPSTAYQYSRHRPHRFAVWLKQNTEDTTETTLTAALHDQIQHAWYKYTYFMVIPSHTYFSFVFGV